MLFKINFLINPNFHFFRLLAAKIYYFGVGGGIASFGEYLDKHGIFKMEDVWSTTTSSVARKILEIKRK